MATDPNWKNNVREALRKGRDKNGRSNTVFGRELRPLQLTATLKYLRYIDDAAKKVNVNRATFVRRSCAVVAAKLLDVDVHTILYESPKAGGYGEQRLRVADGGMRDDGKDIAKWCSHPGCDGQHFR
jgi:hypothetical protein